MKINLIYELIKNYKCMKNRQSAVTELNNEQLQVLLTGKFGDGCLTKNPTCVDYNYSACCIHKEYLEYKAKLLGNLITDNGITCEKNKGYKRNLIYRFRTISSRLITDLHNLSLEETLKLMDELGFALWIYDDGSLHKTKYFYNINTQKYSFDENEYIIKPFLFNKFGIKAKTTIERKKNGKEYWYLRVGKWDGATTITQILQKFPINCYSYKLWDSETIQKWSKLQEQLKSTNKDINTIHPKTLTTMLNKISL